MKTYKLIGNKKIDDKIVSKFEQIFTSNNPNTDAQVKEEVIVQAMFLESEGWETDIKENIHEK